METIFQTIRQRCLAGKASVLVLVIKSSAGTPGKTGAKMLVGENGALYGTVGGGNIEFHAIETAKTLLPDQTFLCEEYVLCLDDERKLGMTCGGRTQLFFHVLRGREGLDFAETGLRMCREKTPYCLAVPMTGGAAQILDMETFHAGQAQLQENFYTECFLHEGKVYIFGGGHVAGELLPLLANLNFRCILLDDRADFADAARFPMAEEIHLIDYRHLNLPITAKDLVIIMTRGHEFDAECERFVLGTEASYIGVMGSRKKADYIRNMLLSEGFSQTDLDRVTTPIGLSIGSRTPQEIAVSIAAQLIEFRAGQRRKKENLL